MTDDERFAAAIRNLPEEIEPERDLWPGIAARLERPPMRTIAALCLLLATSNPFAADRWYRPDPSGRCPENKPLTGDAGMRASR